MSNGWKLREIDPSPDTVGPVNVYIVFYGAWSNLNAVSNINYLVANLGTSNW
jgi:hypothetical protein